jgi:hypothetical protein
LEVGDRSVGWVLHVRERRGKEGATCWALAQEEGGENAREWVGKSWAELDGEEENSFFFSNKF